MESYLRSEGVSSRIYARASGLYSHLRFLVITLMRSTTSILCRSRALDIRAGDRSDIGRRIQDNMKPGQLASNLPTGLYPCHMFTSTAPSSTRARRARQGFGFFFNGPKLARRAPVIRYNHTALFWALHLSPAHCPPLLSTLSLHHGA